MKHLRGALYAIKGKSVALRDGKSSFITSNSIFIDDRQKAIIDPSSDPLTLRRIAEEHAVDFCFVSHAHLDHFCFYAVFPNAKRYLHEKESTLSATEGYVADVSRGDEIVSGRKIANELGLAKFEVHERFHDGQVFAIGDTVLVAVHTPGHTSGHCCFYFPNERILYSADFDLSVMGPWYGQQDSSIEDFAGSAEKLSKLSADIWVTGHWKWIAQDNIPRRIEQYINQIEERETRVLRCLHKARSIRNLANLGLIYPMRNMESQPWMKKSERIMLEKHLGRLEARGIAQRLYPGRWVVNRQETPVPGPDMDRGKQRADTDLLQKWAGSIEEFHFRLVRFYVLASLRLLFWIVFRVRIRGAERLAQARNWILAYKHTKLLDLLLIVASLPFEYGLRSVTLFLTDRSIVSKLRLFALYHVLRVLPIAEVRATSTLASCIKDLESGHTLLLPGEAIHNSLKGSEHYKEIGYIACKSSTRVLPVSIRRNRNGALPRKRSTGGRGSVEIHIEEAVDLPPLQQTSRLFGSVGSYREIGMKIRDRLK